MGRIQPAAVPLIVFSLALLTGCSAASPKNEPKLYAAGEKATVGPLVYSVVDSQFSQVLGDDPGNQRTAQNRFMVVQVSVSNSSNQDVSIAGMSLVDDSGQAYPELADGSGVDHWLGVLRKVSAAQTESGSVLFDVPLKHYRLRLTEDTDPDVSIDIPLNFVHEQLRAIPTSPDTLTPEAAPLAPNTKK